MPAEFEPLFTRLRRAIVDQWAVWLALAFIAVLPLRREMEYPLSIFAFSLAFLARSPGRRKEIRAASEFVLPLFLCIWIPMLISSVDSLDPEKSWWQTLPSLRFLPAALAIALLLRRSVSRATFLRVTCWLLLFWAADGYFQLAFGRDVFGVPMNQDRLNALFYSRYHYYGPTLAMLSPLAIAHMRRHWPGHAWLAGFAFILGAVLISGMRAAWVMMLVVMIAFMVPMLRNPARRWRALSLPAAAALTLGLAVIASPLLQERLKISSLAILGTEQALDEASSYRVPIFKNALAMYRDHPINGVGVRAMRAAYPRYADPDDPHMLANTEKLRAHQAHNIVLEFMADTGTIGLVGLVAAFLVTWRYWRSLDERRREEAFPYAVVLLAIAFPLNSYFAVFGVYTMSITWVMVGFLAAAGLGDPHLGPSEGTQEIPIKARR